ncbi:MAG: Hsp20/alpha crystallin family protein [Gammaproteobacteria bacterium]|nr:Hsp20/alpha crystallin family protein [Gammaproteobacteria bacterium]
MTKAAKAVPVKHEEVVRPKGRINPMARFRHEVDDVFDRFFGQELGMTPLFERMAEMRPEWDWHWKTGFDLTPTVDVMESDKAFEMTAEMPGMDEKDFELVLAEGMLTLKGEKKEEHEEHEKDYRLSERRYGSFQRAFRLPDGVDPGNVTAKFAKGVLHVTLPKSKETQLKQRKVPIKTA